MLFTRVAICNTYDLPMPVLIALLLSVNATLWGGEHVEMQLTKGGAQLEFDCAKGTITESLAPDSEGHFRVKGTFTVEHGGPVRQGEAPQTIDATYAGNIKDDAMTLQLIVGDKELARFILNRGEHGKLRKCR